MPERHVVIVGGGISGLSAAYRLLRRAEAEGIPLRLTVVERERWWGGKIRTVREDGFVVEGGPDAFVTFKPQALRLCDELGLTHRLLPTNPQARQVFVLWQGKLHLLPHGFLTFTPDLKGLWQTGLLSPQGKFRLMLSVALPKPDWNEDVGVGAFFRYYLGAEMTERVIAPLMTGVYGGDAERLSVKATLPMVWEMAHRYRNLAVASLLRSRSRSFIPDPSSLIPHPSSHSFFMTLQGGLSELVETLLAKLTDVTLINGRSVVRLTEAGGGWMLTLDDGETLRTDAVVLATSAHEAVELLRPHDEGMAKELASFPHADAVTVSLAFDRSQVAHRLNGSGFLVAPKEDSPLLACTWTSSKFPPRAPKGKVLLRAFIGKGLDWDDDEIGHLVTKELQPLLGIRGEPERAWVFRWAKAMPQYVVGHLKRMERILQRLERFRRLALAGNYLTGIGIPDCVRSGEEAAKKVWQSLIP